MCSAAARSRPSLRSSSRDALARSERALARGALAYVTNHEADALELLGSARSRGAGRAARRAGRFRALGAQDPARPEGARSPISTGRVSLAPGGLVEEAALRREIALLAETRDAARVALLTRQYADRFAASLYAPDFFRDLARLIARTGLADDPANYRLLSEADSPPAG